MPIALRLTTVEWVRVQRQLFKCGDWLKRLLAVEVLLAEIELVPGDGSLVPNKRKPLFIVHDTSDGFIYSQTERRGRKWFARQWEGRNSMTGASTARCRRE